MRHPSAGQGVLKVVQISLKRTCLWMREVEVYEGHRPFFDGVTPHHLEGIADRGGGFDLTDEETLHETPRFDVREPEIVRLVCSGRVISNPNRGMAKPRQPVATRPDNNQEGLDLSPRGAHLNARIQFLGMGKSRNPSEQCKIRSGDAKHTPYQVEVTAQSVAARDPAGTQRDVRWTSRIRNVVKPTESGGDTENPRVDPGNITGRS